MINIKAKFTCSHHCFHHINLIQNRKIHPSNFFRRSPFIHSQFGNSSHYKIPQRIVHPLRNCSSLASTALIPSTTIPGFHKTALQKFIAHKLYPPMGNEHQCWYAPFVQSKDSLFVHDCIESMEQSSIGRFNLCSIGCYVLGRVSCHGL